MLGRAKNPAEEQKATMSKTQGELGGEGNISIIGVGMKIVGDAETEGTIRVEGRVEGTIRAGKSVVVGRTGEVDGDIITQDAIISGQVTGNITADSRLELQSTCNVTGELRSRRVQLDEGARFNGQMHMDEASKSKSVVVKSADAPAPLEEHGRQQQIASRA